MKLKQLLKVVTLVCLVAALSVTMVACTGSSRASFTFENVQSVNVAFNATQAWQAVTPTGTVYTLEDEVQTFAAPVIQPATLRPLEFSSTAVGNQQARFNADPMTIVAIANAANSLTGEAQVAEFARIQQITGLTVAEILNINTTLTANTNAHLNTLTAGAPTWTVESVRTEYERLRTNVVNRLNDFNGVITNATTGQRNLFAPAGLNDRRAAFTITLGTAVTTVAQEGEITNETPTQLQARMALHIDSLRAVANARHAFEAARTALYEFVTTAHELFPYTGINSGAMMIHIPDADLAINITTLGNLTLRAAPEYTTSGTDNHRSAIEAQLTPIHAGIMTPFYTAHNAVMTAVIAASPTVNVANARAFINNLAGRDARVIAATAARTAEIHAWNWNWSFLAPTMILVEGEWVPVAEHTVPARGVLLLELIAERAAAIAEHNARRGTEIGMTGSLANDTLVLSTTAALANWGTEAFVPSAANALTVQYREVDELIERDWTVSVYTHVFDGLQTYTLVIGWNQIVEGETIRVTHTVSGAQRWEVRTH